jgi:hypothetical protein
MPPALAIEGGRLAGELYTLQVHPTLRERDLDDVAAAIAQVAEVCS